MIARDLHAGAERALRSTEADVLDTAERDVAPPSVGPPAQSPAGCSTRGVPGPSHCCRLTAAAERLYADALRLREKRSQQGKAAAAQAAAAAASYRARPLSPRVYAPDSLHGTAERPEARLASRSVLPHAS